MQKRLMKKATIYSSFILALAFSVSGCGGGGGAVSGAVAATSKTTVQVQDGNILGALVRDNGGFIASAVVGTPGAYTFAPGSAVLLPVTISSQNSAATVSACMDANLLTVCDPANVISYQDLDGNGVYSTGDVLYNGSMTVNYVPSTVGNVIYANPLSSLIPANGVAPAVAGLTAAEVSASANGDITAAAANVRSVAAQLLAVQEALINTGADRTAISAFIQSIAANATGASLTADIQAALTLPGGTLASALYLGASVPTQADLIAAVGNIATAITTTLAGAAVGSTNYEAIIALTSQAVQVRATPLSAAYIQQLGALAGATALNGSMNSTLSAANFDIQSGVIQTAVNNQLAGTTALVNGAFIFPVYNASKLAGHTVVGPSYVFDNITLLDGYTKFSLSYNAASNSITINGTNSTTVGSPAIAGKVLTFDATQQAYAFADPAAAPGAKLFISINLNDGGAKTLNICTDYVNATTVPVCTRQIFTLPLQAELCGFTFSDGSFFASHTLPTVTAGLTSEYGAGMRFTTMNGLTSTCP